MALTSTRLGGYRLTEITITGSCGTSDELAVVVPKEMRLRKVAWAAPTGDATTLAPVVATVTGGTAPPDVAYSHAAAASLRESVDVHAVTGGSLFVKPTPDATATGVRLVLTLESVR